MLGGQTESEAHWHFEGQAVSRDPVCFFSRVALHLDPEGADSLLLVNLLSEWDAQSSKSCHCRDS